MCHLWSAIKFPRIPTLRFTFVRLIFNRFTCLTSSSVLTDVTWAPTLLSSNVWMANTFQLFPSRRKFNNKLRCDWLPGVSEFITCCTVPTIESVQPTSLEAFLIIYSANSQVTANQNCKLQPLFSKQTITGCPVLLNSKYTQVLE